MAVDGTYKIEIDTPMGKQESTLVLKTDGNKLTGSDDSPMGKSDFSGTVTGNDLAWELEITTPMGNMKLEFKGKVAGNDISGDVKIGNFGNAAFKGKKI